MSPVKKRLIKTESELNYVVNSLKLLQRELLQTKCRRVHNNICIEIQKHKSLLTQSFQHMQKEHTDIKGLKLVKKDL